MSSTTKPFEEKMNASVNHLIHELASIRAGRANPAILDKVTVDYYGSPTPIQQIAAVAVAEARILTMDKFKAMKKAGELTEDDQKKLEEETQKLTDKYVKLIDDTCADKNKEIMEV